MTITVTSLQLQQMASMYRAIPMMKKNQLIKTVAGGKTVINTYNGEGLRVAKSVNGSLTRYLYEYDKVILEVNGSGNQIARNLYGINLLMRTVDGESYYYMYNGHADVTALVNAATGEVAATYYYDAFGIYWSLQEM